MTKSQVYLKLREDLRKYDTLPPELRENCQLCGSKIHPITRCWKLKDVGKKKSPKPPPSCNIC